MARNFDSAEDFALSRSKGMSSDKRMVRYRPSASKPMFDYQVGYDFGEAARNLVSMPSKLMESLQKLPQAAADSSGKDYKMDTSFLNETKEYPPLLPVRGLPKASSSKPVAGGGMSSSRRATQTRVPSEPSKPIADVTQTENSPTTLVQSSVAPTVATPLRDEASSARDRIRMQIANEQRTLLDNRRTGKVAKGSGVDSDSLANIASLRRELAGYDSAARPVQAPSSPERNFMANRDVAGQAAKIMQGDLAAMEQRVYTMPPGPAKDAELEKVRAFKSKTNEQFVRGNVLRPDDVGPPVDGASATGYADAMSEAERQTGSQMAAAGRDYDRRGQALAFTKDITAKRLAEEQRTKDMDTAVYDAGMAGIRRPQDEFKLRQDAVTTEMRAREAAIKEAERRASRTDSLTEEQIASEKWKRDPLNPANRSSSAQADLYGAQAAKEVQRINRGGLNANDIAEADAQFANAGAGDADVEGALGALRDVTTQVSDGKYVGTSVTGNADDGLRAVAKIGTVVQGLKNAAASNPDKARAQARKMLAEMQKLTGEDKSGGGLLATAAGGALAGGAAGAIGGGVGALPGAAIGGIAAVLARTMRSGMNQSQREKLVRDWNQMYSDLQQIAGQ